jgi:putative ABC transport system permease protein
MAGAAVWAYRLRSSFVASGVALGVAALTIIVASIDGANRKAMEMVHMFGPDAAFVLGGNIESRAVGMRFRTLTLADVQRLRQSLPGAYLVVPMQGKSDVTVRHGTKKTQVANLVGTTSGYARVWNWPLSEGRDFSEEDVRRGAKVALIGETPAGELFADRSPIGQTVLVDQLPVQIIGRLAYRGVSGGAHNVDERMILPITTLTQRFNLDRNYFRAIRVKFHAPELMVSHVANLESLLRDSHGLKEGEKNDFTILTADEVLKFMAMFKGGLVFFLGLTAVVALLAGGFVLANLFYLSVQERRMEIGLKKALGASHQAIMVQVLMEAVCLTLIGAIAGLLLGKVMGRLLERFDVLELMFSWKVFILAVAAAIAIGFIFGLRPARQAATLSPIEALKS